MDGNRPAPIVLTSPVGNLAWVPQSPLPGGVMDQLVQEVASLFKGLVTSTATVTSNPQLTIHGQVAALTPARVAATERLGRVQEATDSQEALQDKREAELLAVPEASPAGVLTDQEQRKRLDDVDPTKRNAALALAERGQAPRLSLALIRDPSLGEPLCTLEPGVAERCWEATRRAQEPATFKALDDERAAIAWARPIISQAAQLVERLSAIPMGSGAGKSVKHILFDAQLRDTAYRAWGITDADWAAFIRQQTGQSA